MKRTPIAAATGIAAIWLGMLIGVSFVATPVKFTAPSLELGPALDVGRVTFGLFTRLEWGLAALTAAAILAARPRRGLASAAVVLAAIVLAQSAWLLPALDARVAAVLGGHPLPPSWEHRAYGILEALKALILCAVVVAGFRRLAAGPTEGMP